ncbi:chitinase 1-like isoform X2 [Silene latifolia]|uniref:chitinase 1-like isoform X2 n=1 Tax=Silene latifolia TaxID=37657 RepID=UPI003D787ECA
MKSITLVAIIILSISLLPSNDADVSSVVTQSFFDGIIGQAAATCAGKNFYTRDAFLNALGGYPQFGTSGANNDNLREIAAFFANVAHETGGLNVGMAGVILYELQESTSVVSKEANDGLHEVGVAGEECVRSTLFQDESLRTASSRLLGSVNVKDIDTHKDIGAFLFQMLGDGFQLDMEIINEVLEYGNTC